MMRFGLQLSAIALCLLSLVTRGFGQEEQKTAAEPAAAPPAAAQPAAASGTLKVKPEPFKIEVEMSGVFEADQAAPVALRTKSWSDLTVLKAVPHGKRVQKGETLVWLDMEGIDEQLHDAEQGLRLSKLALQLATTELESTKTTLPMDLESVARTKKIADEDLNYFLKINRSFLEESAQFSLKSSAQSLEYSEEELKQLEKMYNADDLTEETEEIVLKRARNEVEQAKFYLKSTELRTKKLLEQDIARQEQQLSEAAQRAGVALDKTRVTLPVQFEKQQIELQKLTVDNKRAEEKLAGADRRSESHGGGITGRRIRLLRSLHARQMAGRRGRDQSVAGRRQAGTQQRVHDGRLSSPPPHPRRRRGKRPVSPRPRIAGPCRPGRLPGTETADHGRARVPLPDWHGYV